MHFTIETRSSKGKLLNVRFACAKHVNRIRCGARVVAKQENHDYCDQKNCKEVVS